MIVISAGNKYLDIDAYASGIAYAVLLQSFGEEVVFASSAKENMSICPLIKELGFNVDRDYEPKEEDKFIVLDLSNPEFFDVIINSDNIIEVIDHHTGFEEYWKDNIENSQIEFIGSVATIIFERFKKANKLNLLTPKLCRLLVAAILDNTLNLKSNITTKRDILAYEELKKIGKIEDSFDEQYFASCQEIINENVFDSVKSDLKIETVSSMLPEIFGQLMVYDKTPILEKIDEVEMVFENADKPWFINIICLKDGKSYLFTTNLEAQKMLEKLFSKKFENNLLVLSNFMLRKEIMKMARKKTVDESQPNSSN